MDEMGINGMHLEKEEGLGRVNKFFLSMGFHVQISIFKSVYR